MLEYENNILLDLLSDDGLIIGAKGLGLENIFLSLTSTYSDAGNLILVIGTNQKEEEYFISHCEEKGIEPLPKSIKAECTVGERSQIYLEGGVLFVSSRILVTDILRQKCPVEHVTGIIVWRAHKIIESCQEAFILRLFRQKNKKGFIKAFSSSPISYTIGFCDVERIMRNLFVKKLYLLPRFHVEVSKCLDVKKPNVTELHLKMTEDMMEIQKSLVDLIHVTVQELKLSNRTLDIDELNTENTLSKSFEMLVKVQLEPVWNQLSTRTKQLVADLKILRTMLTYLCQYDCITFYNLVNSLRTTEKAMQSAGWMLNSAADSLFVNAQKRVFNNQKSKEASDKNNKVPKFELNPKWIALSEALDDIRKEVKDDKVLQKCLIVTQDDRTTRQLKEYLTDGSEKVLGRIYYETIGKSKGLTLPPDYIKNDAKPKKDDTGKAKGSAHQYDDITLTQINKKYDFIGQSEESSSKPSSNHQFQSPLILVQSYKGYSDPFMMVKTLEEVNPKYIIMYDTDLTFIRQIEVWQADRATHVANVFFLIYKGTVEEQMFLSNMKREKDAFEFLIKQKNNMVLPEYTDGKSEDNPGLSRDPRKASEKIYEENAKNTRAGGAQPSEFVEQRVVVDMREFRSELPALIHKRGMEIDPATIEVGDYILTPKICVERKSLSDLIGSLNSGRLYNQALAMTRHYEKPILLIEFDTNKPFHLQGRFFLSNDSSDSSKNVSNKLQLLTLHFPNLRILWCPSPYATAELFELIKDGKEQPSVEEAQGITADSNKDLNSDSFNSSIKDFVVKLPGVTTKNIFSLLRSVKNMVQLMTLSQEKLDQILGHEANSKKLYSALHNKMKITDTKTNKGIKYTKKGLKRFRS